MPHPEKAQEKVNKNQGSLFPWNTSGVLALTVNDILTHIHTQSTNPTHLQHLVNQIYLNSLPEPGNLKRWKKSKIKGNMTHYQHLDRPKPNSNKNLLLFLMPKHSVWKYGPSGPTPTTNFLSFWCRRILLGSTGHPVWKINGEDWTTNLGGQLGEQRERGQRPPTSEKT